MKTICTLIITLSVLCISYRLNAQTFNGPPEACYNRGYLYTYIDDVTYTTSEWTYTGGATYVSGTGLSRTVKFIADGSITVKLLNGSLVVSQVTKSVIVIAPGSISGPSQMCSGGSVTLTKSGTAGAYLWEVSTDGINWSSLSNPASLNHSPSVTSQYRIRMTDCASSYSNTHTVTVYPQTQVGNLVVSGANEFCGTGTLYLAFSTNPVGSIQWQSRYQEGAGGAWTSWTTFGTGDIPSTSTGLTSNGTLTRYYEFRVIVQSGICSAITGNTVTAAVNPTPQPGAISVAQGTNFYGSSGALNLSVSSSVGTVSYEVSSDGSTWSPVSNPTPGYTSSRLFRAKATSGNCPTLFSSPVTVNVYPSPVITITGPTEIPVGVSTSLSVQNTFAAYQWMNGAANIAGATASTYTVTEPGEYNVKVKGSATAPEVQALPKTITSSLQTQAQAINYHVVTNVYKQGFTTASNFYTLQANEVRQVVDYMDGYGRSVQQIVIGQTPGRKDVVQPYRFLDVAVNQYSYPVYGTDAATGKYQINAIKTVGAYATSDHRAFYQTAGLLPSDGSPFARAVIETGPLARVKEQGNVGADWQPGTAHTIRQSIGVNNDAYADAALKNIRKFTTAGPSGSHASNMLQAVTTIDENGNKVWTFTDKLGRVVLKRVQLDETLETIVTPFLDTYYVYDDRGNLAIQVPPKAIAKLNGGTAWSTTLRDEWCFVYTYDARNRLVEKKTPDAAAIYFGYDPLDRLVLMQDANLRTSNKWMFIKYDLKGRPVMTGLYLNTTQTTRTAVQDNVLNPLYASGAWYEDRGTTLHGYTNQSFPTTNSTGTAIEVLNVNYYDTYDFDFNGTDDYTYTSQGITGEGTQFRSFDLPTGSKRLIIGTTTWLSNYNFYDKYGHVIQSRYNNHLSAAIDNLTTYVYKFDGTLERMKTFHKGASGTTVTTLQRLEYDHAGRVVKLYQSINGGAEVQVTGYAYNELGQLIDKKLHSTDGTNFLQSIDYRYNIRGWLTSINNAQLNVNAANNDDTNDYFGLELLYNTQEAGLNNQTGDAKFWNGNVSAVKWKSFAAGSGTAGQRSYKFSYDKSDKLKKATFQAYATSNWTKEATTLNEQMTYDANGNIINLQRNRNLRGTSGLNITSTAQTIDNLTYTYASGLGNRLTKVEDAIAGTTGELGFKNGVNTTTEYTYDVLGSITKDDNKGISSIVYNVLGKPATINFTDGKKIEYLYDAAGNKITMKNYQGVTLLNTTDYVGGFVYSNNALSFFGSPEGRVVKKGSVYEYEYAIADHQGNTRVVFSSVTPAPTTYTATFENGTMATETANFLNYPTGGNRSGLELFDHTDFSGTTYTYSNLLNGGNNSQVGLAKTIKVYPGDKVKLEAFAKYYNPQGTGNLTGFAAALTTAFGLSAASTGEAALAYQTLNTYGGVVAGGGGNGTSSYPKAFVTILLFDKDYKLVDFTYNQIDGGQQVGVSPKAAHDAMMCEYTVKEAGYAYMYISNENPTMVEVYFDDITVTYTPSNLIQGNEYYPFGLQTANSWTRDGNKNDYLYNEGAELNATSGWYETFFRGYDPALGKFLQVDPMTDKYASWTPYNYGFNSPGVFNDPSGAQPPSMMYSQYESAASGGCGCWRDKGPQDADAGMYGESNSQFGAGYIPGYLYGTSPGLAIYAVQTSFYQTAIKRALAYAHRWGSTVNVNSDGGVTVNRGWRTESDKRDPSGLRYHFDTKFFYDWTMFQQDYAEGVLTDFNNSNWALTIGGGIFGVMEGLTVSQGYWLGKNGKYYTSTSGRGPNRYTGSRSGAFTAANRYKWAGRSTIILSGVIGVYSTMEGIELDGDQFGYNAQHAAASTIGSIGFGIAGAEAGALIGAGIGAWFGGVGAIPGAVLGGVIGGFWFGVGGSYLGGYLGGNAIDYYHGR